MIRHRRDLGPKPEPPIPKIKNEVHKLETNDKTSKKAGIMVQMPKSRNEKIEKLVEEMRN